MTVALWTIYHYSPAYEFYGDEAEAASMAVAMQERHKADDAARAAAASSEPRKPAPPQRVIRDPFCGYEMDVDASEPGWIGR